MKGTTKLLLLTLAALLSLTSMAYAQTFQRLHTFEETDGLAPGALTMDAVGNLYGAAAEGGIQNCPAPNNAGCGTIFELSMKNSAWVFTTVYQFQSAADGYSPNSPLTVGSGGILYGTTLDGGIEGGYGSVFRLRPTCKDLGCSQVVWNKTILYGFGPCNGAGTNGGLVFDTVGNLYGTIVATCNRLGQVYELSPAQNLNGMWDLTPVRNFQGPPGDGRWPEGPVTFDQSGNLYGTTLGGGSNDYGTVYELIPQSKGWSEKLLYQFDGSDGIHPIGNLIFDGSGNLYGTTLGDPQPSGAFELTPSNGSWDISRRYPFLPGQAQIVSSGLVMDSAGNLYGAAQQGGGSGYGTIYKLTPIGNNSFSYSSVYDFSGGSDGANPQGPLVMDAHGNLYGSAAAGGDLGCNSGIGCGTVWMIALN